MAEKKTWHDPLARAHCIVCNCVTTSRPHRSNTRSHYGHGAVICASCKRMERELRDLEFINDSDWRESYAALQATMRLGADMGWQRREALVRILKAWAVDAEEDT